MAMSITYLSEPLSLAFLFLLLLLGFVQQALGQDALQVGHLGNGDDGGEDDVDDRGVLTKMMGGVCLMGVSDGGVMDLMTGEHCDALTDDGPLRPAKLLLMEEWEADEEVK